MLDKNPTMFVSIVLLTIIRAANRVSMSVGDPQNCIEPLPNKRRELFLFTDSWSRTR
jgi:hypothetical protein